MIQPKNKRTKFAKVNNKGVEEDPPQPIIAMLTDK